MDAATEQTEIASKFVLIHLLFLITKGVNAFEEKFIVEPNYIFVTYGDEIKGDKPSEFHHYIDITVFDHVKPSTCKNDLNKFCVQWSDFAKFQVTKKDSKCNTYELITNYQKPLRVRFDTTFVHLYGGANHGQQTWPTDSENYEEYPFLTMGAEETSVLEPFWLVSNGMYLYVDQTTPLFLSQNKNKRFFELIASREPPYVRTSGTTKMKYTLCKLDNMREAYMHAVENVLGKPSGLPDERMVRYPIWSTWAKYKTKIDTKVVTEYANLVSEIGLPNSHLEIDDIWETCYGSLTVNKRQFSDMSGLVKKLKEMGYRVTFWIHPFVNLDCEPYHSEGVRNGYFVKNQSGSVAGEWWNGKASQIDFTNPEAKDWFISRVKKLQADTGVDSFKFDAGERTWAPAMPVYHKVAEDHPETNLKYYVQATAEFGGMVEVRVARGTQKHPIFVRMVDRESKWDGNMGFQTLVPMLLLMNMLGYPFVLPDMVGGNGYNEVISNEMYTRWLQATVFMPSIQFSYLPSDYGSEAVALTKKFVNLHVQYSDKILEAMKNSVKYGTPVNAPIWWIDPTDPVAQMIDSEFLLGEDILVAPVLQQGARNRDIYLPKGYWKDEVNKNAEIIKGPVWLYNYPAELEVLPFFTKVSDPPTPPKHDDDNEEDKKSSSAGASTLPTLISIVIALILSKMFNFRF